LVAQGVDPSFRRKLEHAARADTFEAIVREKVTAQDIYRTLKRVEARGHNETALDDPGFNFESAGALAPLRLLAGAQRRCRGGFGRLFPFG
jgi:hypothetical protein